MGTLCRLYNLLFIITPSNIVISAILQRKKLSPQKHYLLAQFTLPVGGRTRYSNPNLSGSKASAISNRIHFLLVKGSLVFWKIRNTRSLGGIVEPCEPMLWQVRALGLICSFCWLSYL